MKHVEPKVYLVARSQPQDSKVDCRGRRRLP